VAFDKHQLRKRLRAYLRLAPLPLSLRERVGERVQAGLLKSPRIKILLLSQCAVVSRSAAETRTLTLSLVRERASISSSFGNFMRKASRCEWFFDSPIRDIRERVLNLVLRELHCAR